MKTLDQIKTQFCTAVTVAELQSLLSDAISAIEFEQARNALVGGRLKKAEDQITRQTAMITNLENTLWKKK